MSTSSTSPKPRVTYVIAEYPQLSQTYIKGEIEALAPDHDIQIIATRPAGEPYTNHLPYVIAKSVEEAIEQAREFRPHVLHTHWLSQVPRISKVAQALGVGFTVRSHSFDTLLASCAPRFSDGPRAFGRWAKAMRRMREGTSPLLRDDSCLGVLCFPFVEKSLRRLGVPAAKLRPSFPVVDVQRFQSRSDNGDGVMSVGAALAKKRYDDFIALAARNPSRPFDLYAFDYDVGTLRQQNETAGSPATICDPVAPEEMPAVYKRHEWLLYTGSRERREVGWPCSVAEAQASGVGVLMPDLGKDVRDYVGEAGFVYSSLDEAHAIMSKPFPTEMRELGFELAPRSDIRKHVTSLTEFWPSPATTA